MIEESQLQLEIRRSSRVRHPSSRYSSDEFFEFTTDGELQSFDEAVKMKDKEEWIKAMNEEMILLHENQTYELVELPKGKRPLKNKWAYKLKFEEGRLEPQYKAQIVVKSCNKKKGIDFEEIFSPMVKMSSIRVVLGLAACLDLKI